MITALPTPPSRSDSVNFASRADAFLGALPTFATEANALATDVNTKSDLVTTNSELTAANTEVASAAAAIAVASSNFKGNWSSLTGALSLPASVSHNGTFWTLTSNVADVTAHTPGVSSVWLKSVPSLLSGATTTTTNLTLNSNSASFVNLQPTAIGQSVTLPNATTLDTGICKYVLDNTSGQFPVGVLNSSGQVLGQVLPGDSVQFHLLDKSTVAGQWRTSGNFDPVWITNEIQLNLTRSNGANLWSIDSTRCLIVWTRSNDGFVIGRVVTWNSVTSTPTVSSEFTLATSTLSVQNVVAIGTNRALVRMSSNTLTLINTDTGTAGSPTSVTLTTGNLGFLQAFDSQYALTGNVDASGGMRVRCLDCGTTGTTITAATEVTSGAITAASGINIFTTTGGIQQVSSTLMGFVGSANNSSVMSYWAVSIARTTGTTLVLSTNAGNPASADTAATGTILQNIYPLSASTALVPYYGTSTGMRYAVLTFASGSCTWGSSVASNVVTNYSNVNNFAASPDRTRFVAAQTISSGSCNIEAVTVSGTTVTVGASTSFSSETAGSASISNGMLAVTNQGRGVIYWRGQSFGGSGGPDKLRLFTLSGTTFTFSSEISSAASAGAGANLSTNMSIADLQSSCGDNIFRISSSSSGTIPVVRNTLFRVSSSATMDIIAEFDVVGGTLSVSPRLNLGNTNLIADTSFSQGTAERIWIDTATKQTIRAKVPSFRFASQMSNNVLGWSNNLRAIGLGLLSPYTTSNGNAILQTHRIAEV